MAKRRSSGVNINVYGEKTIVNAANAQNVDFASKNSNGENEDKPKNKIDALKILGTFIGLPAAIVAILAIISNFQPSVARISEQELIDRIIDGVFYEKQQYIFTVPYGPVVCRYSPTLDSRDLDRSAMTGKEIRTNHALFYFDEEEKVPWPTSVPLTKPTTTLMQTPKPTAAPTPSPIPELTATPSVVLYSKSGLSAAIASAEDGDVIELVAGSYPIEAVTLSKNLTIRGVSKEVTTITLDDDVTDWISVNPGCTLTIMGVAFDGQATKRTVDNAFYIAGCLDISDSVVKNIKSAIGKIGTGICSDAGESPASLIIDGLIMKDIEYAGIKLVDGIHDAETIITNFKFYGSGSVMPRGQYGIISNGRGARITDSMISGCYGVDEVGNTSSAIFVYGNKRTTREDSELSFRNFKDTEINFYVETSDLADNQSSIYAGIGTRSDAEIVVRYSLLGNVRVRHGSYVDVNFNFWGEDKSGYDIAAMIEVFDHKTMPDFKVFFDKFYTSASAALAKSKMLHWGLQQKTLNLEVDEVKGLDDLLDLKNRNNLYFLSAEDKQLVFNHITYTSSDTSVVTVDNSNGACTGHKEGETTVTVSFDGWDDLIITINVLGTEGGGNNSPNSDGA